MGRELSEKIRKESRGRPTEVNTVYNDASKKEEPIKIQTVMDSEKQQ